MGGVFGGNPVSKMNAAERNSYADLAVGTQMTKAMTGPSGKEAAHVDYNSPNKNGKLNYEVTAKERDELAAKGLEMFNALPAGQRDARMKAAAEDGYEIKVTDKDVAHHQQLQNARSLAFQMGRSA